MCSKGLHSGLGVGVPLPLPCALGHALAGDGMWGGKSVSCLSPGTSCPCSSSSRSWDRGQQRYSRPKTDSQGKKSRRESEGWAEIADCGGCSGSQEMPGMEGGRNWPRMAFALSLPFSLLSPPSSPPSLSTSLPSSRHTSLLVPVIVLICMSGKALLHTQKENPSRGGVAVSALAVVRQCKIKLIKPPTQENITGN